MERSDYDAQSGQKRHVPPEMCLTLGDAPLSALLRMAFSFTDDPVLSRTVTGWLCLNGHRLDDQGQRALSILLAEQLRQLGLPS